MKDKLALYLNRLLIADFFLVILIFVWFAIAVFGRSAGVSLGLDLWLKLWQPVFNPALGILMAGAIFSGVMNWVSNRFSPDR